MAIVTRIDRLFELHADLEVVVVNFPGPAKFRESMCVLDHGDPAVFCGTRSGRTTYNAAIDRPSTERISFRPAELACKFWVDDEGQRQLSQ